MEAANALGGEGWGWEDLEALHYQPGRRSLLGRHREAVSIHFYLVVRTKIDSLIFKRCPASVNLRTEEFGGILEFFRTFYPGFCKVGESLDSTNVYIPQASI